MLVGIEMDAIEGTGVNHAAGVEEDALQLLGDTLVRVGDSGAPLWAPANFRAMVPPGVRRDGGATIRTRGTDMPGSIGARRIACTSAAIPCADCHAAVWCTD
jgi:hypothetical protein